MFPENISKNFDNVKEIAFSDIPMDEKMQRFDEFNEIEVFCKDIAKTVKNCFLPIDGFDEYAVSPFGDVISLKSDHIRLLSQCIEGDGYLFVLLYRNGKKYTSTVHRLVAKTFLLNPDQMPQVNHADGNKYNNRLDNLEFCTAKENMQHAYKTGLHSKRGRLTEDELNQIVDMLNAGVIYRDIANMFNISSNQIKYIATGRSHKELYGKIDIPEKTNAKKIRCIETGKIYSSQKEAAMDLNIDAGCITKNLKGKLPHVKGFHFERA